MKNLRNSAERREIEDRLRSLHHNSARQWGKMTAHQMVMHLNDSYRVPLGEFRVSPKPMPALMKWGALWFPMKWPAGIATRPELDQAIAGTAPGDFAYDVDLLLTVIDRFCRTDPGTFTEHPNFGKMNASEWMRWGYLHADHHLRQFGA